ncbi:CAAX protease [Leptolyngbya ohadii]|uniref:CAAX protease n=1 Tax=Leptolyngbya ohadii TaxID=1962290 RepID=UPI000B599F21|nr:CAAX protease [Leptolyngbya ohadii]
MPSAEVEALQTVGRLLGGAFSLNSEIYRSVSYSSDALWLPLSLSREFWIALLTVLLAGLSLSLGQAIVLFVNRVKPARFVFSLLLNAVLFTFGFLFLVVSTWLICWVSWTVSIPLLTLIKVLGLSYAPLLFSFLGALPYLGVPILTMLSVWRLLSAVVGFSAVAGVSAGTGFGYVAIGWVVLQLLEGTIGQPIARLGKHLADRVAGVPLRVRSVEILELVRSSFSQPASPMIPAGQSVALNRGQTIRGQAIQQGVTRLRGNRAEPERVRSLAQAAQASANPQFPAGGRTSTQEPIALEESIADTQRESGEAQSSEAQSGQAQMNSQTATQQIKLLSLLAMGVLFVVIAMLLRPIKESVFGWYSTLPSLLVFLFDLFWIGIVAIVFAGILAPLETLGWWAGWYGDDLDTNDGNGAAQKPGTAAPDSAEMSRYSRYIVYLDGIGQSGEEYTPDVMDFLDALESALPSDVMLVRGLMMYSVLNKPLNEDRPLAFLWALADKVRFSNPAALLGILLNLRNVFIVAVSADKRYGPIYNQGIAQVLYNGLLEREYIPGSGVPITLIGYSGGGEMSVAAAPYLTRATGAPIDVVSLGGVMSANNNFLVLQHLYHLVGKKDIVERIGPMMFPGRWKLFFLSYWNRAKRQGRISIIPLGEMGHQVPGGYMDPEAQLPSGETCLEQTIASILKILQGEFIPAIERVPHQLSHYQRYKRAPFNSPAFYPLGAERNSEVTEQSLDPNRYQPIGDWMGRLILPQHWERHQVRGVWFEVYHAPPEYRSLIGQRLKLRWSTDPEVQQFVKKVTRDVHFSPNAEFTSEYGGLVHPDRLNHWQQVNPLESLAGSHPVDDVVVMLEDVGVDGWMGGRVGEWESGSVGGAESDRGSHETGSNHSSTDQTSSSPHPSTHPPIHSSTPQPTLYTRTEPIQITGRFYALVQFVQPIAGTDCFQVVHFNRASRQFDGETEIVRLPSVIADENGCFPSTTQGIEQSYLNETGWYIFGAQDRTGMFVVQSVAPRSLLRLQPDRVLFGRKRAYQYIHREAWAEIKSQKGKISSVLLDASEGMGDGTLQAAIDRWKLGDRALLLHSYGGIGGKKREPAAASPIFFGHFAYGMAEVVHDPLADELRFDIRYHQVYTHNTDGLIAGTLHWSRYLGDRQFGWVGARPVCDILIKLEAFTGRFEYKGTKPSPLDTMLRQLQVMTARYRIGDGTGGTYVGPANNCAQDSNQALFASIRAIQYAVQMNPDIIQAWLETHPEQADRYDQLIRLGKALQRQLQPFGDARSDWKRGEFNLGCTLEDSPLRNLWMGLTSWRTLLPRLASDAIVRVFLREGASVWVLRTNQIGGNDPDIEPIAPMTL